MGLELGRGPVVFLDVDGVLSPVAPGSSAWDDWELVDDSPFHLVLSRRMAERIRDLDAEVVWLTTWEHDANAVVAEVLAWDPNDVVVRRDTGTEWWKLVAIAERIEADPRPFVWVDDELERRKREVERWLRGLDVPALAISPRPEVGLTAAELEQIEEFVAEHGEDQDR